MAALKIKKITSYVIVFCIQVFKACKTKRNCWKAVEIIIGDVQTVQSSHLREFIRQGMQSVSTEM